LFVSLECFVNKLDRASGVTLTAPKQLFPRWDRADLSGYYKYTGDHLAPFIAKIDELILNDNHTSSCIDELYVSIVSILINGERLFVPRHSKNFYKFWWNEELSLLKKAAVETNKIWKATGKPRSGPIFNNRQKSRIQYRKRLRECEQQSTLSYSNDLHDALLNKNGAAFWKCWHSKFKGSTKCVEVDNCVDPDVIVKNFASYFAEVYTHNNTARANQIVQDYLSMRSDYCGFPLTDEHTIDAELVGSVISQLHTGKAPDIAGLTSEHLLYSHPSVPVLLTKLFNLIVQCKRVPEGFTHSYIVPIPKIKDPRIKSMTYDDFRGIAISPLMSKVFEHCILDRFSTYFTSCDAQYGFKKGVGCRNAIHTVHTIVNKMIEGGNTVNICAIDLSKAFDKVNHKGLFTKLMKRHIPTELLELLENWLSVSSACVKWVDSWSRVFMISSGVRQGSVLSPFLFAVYVDDIGKLQDSRVGKFIVLYADDILLLAPSVTALQELFTACEHKIDATDMSINVKKSCCMRIGPRHNKICSEISTLDGRNLAWVGEIRYLGVFIVRALKFKCSIDQAKRSFYRAANSIFAKLGRLASEEVIIQLLKQKCLPILLYALEVCNLDKRSLQSLDFTVNRFFMKLFKTSNIEIVHYCQDMSGVQLPSVLLGSRYQKFLSNMSCHAYS